MTNSGTVKKVSFLSNNIKIVADLYYPNNITLNDKHAQAIVVAHPGAGVKEQTAGLYAKRLSENGFITLAFDAAYQGESEGTPRGLEDPSQRVEDIKAAAAFLGTLAEVDATKIGVLGICASGGYALVATATSHNIKALATVSGVDLGDWYRKGSDGKQNPAVMQGMLDAAAAIEFQQATETHQARLVFVLQKSKRRLLAALTTKVGNIILPPGRSIPINQTLPH